MQRRRSFPPRGSRATRLALVVALVVALVGPAGAGVAGCDSSSRDSRTASAAPLPPTPAEHAEGERLFDANCARCHGGKAVGTDSGPPLVHVTYEPSHHADAAFLFAMQRGVAQHHWRFGDMPPQPHVSDADARRITAYVRWLQRQAGIE